MIRAVIFDLDDTLAPELSFVKSGYRAVAQKLENKLGIRAEETAGRLWELFKEDSRNVFNRYLESINEASDRDSVMELVKLYREHIPDRELYKLYEDAEPVLSELRAAGIKLGLLSDGFAVSQRNKADALMLDKKLDEILLTDELGREYWKPNSLGFLTLAERLAVKPDEMIYIGDNPKKDFYIKKELPITTVRIMRPEGVYRAAEYMDNIREDYTIDGLSYKEILNIIGV